MKNPKLKLTLNISYEANGVPVEHLKKQLECALDHAISNGLLTGETSATVESFNTNISIDLSEIHAAKVGTPEHKAFVEALQEVESNVSDGSIRKDYSGRFMYGKTCYGIEANDQSELMTAIGAAGLPAPKMDNMGLGVIAYWKGIEGEDEEYDDE